MMAEWERKSLRFETKEAKGHTLLKLIEIDSLGIYVRSLVKRWGGGEFMFFLLS
jgi:hypothetical protein